MYSEAESQAAGRVRYLIETNGSDYDLLQAITGLKIAMGGSSNYLGDIPQQLLPLVRPVIYLVALQMCRMPMSVEDYIAQIKQEVQKALT